MAVHIAHHVLQFRFPIENIGSINAHDIVVTDDNFGAAKPLTSPTLVRVQHTLLPTFTTHRIVCIQGFVGNTEEGVITTMGKESSSLTATVLASLIQASEVVIYSDVVGLRSADPHLVSNTIARTHISYELARQCAQNGLKLLFPTMIEPAENANIPIRIASAEAPNGNSTIISGKGALEWFVLQTPNADDTTTITCIHANKSLWFAASHEIAKQLQHDEILDVQTNFAQNLAHMRVSTNVAQQAATIFHSALIQQ